MRNVSLGLELHKDSGKQSMSKKHFRELSRNQRLFCELTEAGRDSCML